jgi:hypothetical protein
MPRKTQDMAALGRKGGQATVAKYGVEHMRAIGKRGFAAFATFARGGRSQALAVLAGRNKIKPFTPGTGGPCPVSSAEVDALIEQIEQGAF